MAKWRGARPPFPCARLRRLVVVVRCGRSTSAPGSPPLRLLRHRRRVSPGLGLVVFCGGLVLRLPTHPGALFVKKNMKIVKKFNIWVYRYSFPRGYKGD